MSDLNPYQAPESNLVSTGDDESPELRQPRSVSAGQGWAWLRDAFSLYGRDWGLWIGMSLVFALINIVLGIVPLGSIVSSLLGPVFVAGMVLAARDSDRGDPVMFSSMFAGFQKSTGALIGIGAIAFVSSFVLIGVGAFVIFVMIGGASLLQATTNPELMANALGPGVMIVVLITMALYIPVLMLLWFASTLVILHEVPVFQAMGMSFQGCLSNMLPFLVYGLIAAVISLIGAIPFGLGILFVVMPVLIISLYTAYKDIYLHTTVAI